MTIGNEVLMVPTTDDAARDALRERLQGRTFGDVRVVDVATDARFDSDGNESTVVTLLLEPPAGAGTWALDDVYELRSQARRAAGELDLGPVSFLVTSAGEADTDDSPEGMFDLDDALPGSQDDQ